MKKRIFNENQRDIFRHSNGRSDESLDSSGEVTSSITPNNQVHYADESDEGLVKFSLFPIEKCIQLFF